jgi:hypothetical protein
LEREGNLGVESNIQGKDGIYIEDQLERPKVPKVK